MPRRRPTQPPAEKVTELPRSDTTKSLELPQSDKELPAVATPPAGRTTEQPRPAGEPVTQQLGMIANFLQVSGSFSLVNLGLLLGLLINVSKETHFPGVLLGSALIKGITLATGFTCAYWFDRLRMDYKPVADGLFYLFPVFLTLFGSEERLQYNLFIAGYIINMFYLIHSRLATPS